MTDTIEALADTNGGRLRGTADRGLSIFKAIPYAAPPVGDLRWRPPAPPAPWNGVRDATHFADRCIQAADLGIFAREGGVEDCLYLNVYAPREALGAAAKLPVLFWIHGGSHFVGSACDYDASKLSSEGNAVVVTVNFRLGLFGIFAHPALADEGTSCGNFGIMDQQAALRWIRENIAAFGGDPENVTIFGESSGGSSVFAHILAEGSAGLFHHGIAMSGGSVALRYPAFGGVPPLAMAYRKAEQFARAVGCHGGNLLRDLRALPVGTVMANRSPYFHNQLIIDGVTIPDHPTDCFKAGRFNDVTIVSGHTRDEGTFFAALGELASGRPMDEVGYHQAFEQYYGPELGPAVMSEYPAKAYPTPSHAYAAAVTSSLFVCPGRSLHRVIGPSARLYVYEFADRTAPSYIGQPSFLLGASHSFELPYLFPGFNGAGVHPVALNEQQEQVSREMVRYWTTVSDAGGQNWGWPRYSASIDNVLLFGQSDSSVSLDHSARIHHQAFWDKTDLFN